MASPYTTDKFICLKQSVHVFEGWRNITPNAKFEQIRNPISHLLCRFRRLFDINTGNITKLSLNMIKEDASANIRNV